MNTIAGEKGNYDVIIVGGGIAGLVTAYRLHNAGHAVILLEKGQHLGGAIRSAKRDGYLSELGPNTVLETSPLVTDLIREIGLENEKIYANDSSKIRYIVRDRVPVPLPASPPAFFKSKLFSIRAKLKLIKEPFIPAWDNLYEESLSQFVLRRLGREFLDYAVNPFVAGVFAGNPERISVKHAFPKLYSLEQKYGSLIKGQIKGAKERRQRQGTEKQSARMFSFNDGLQTLPDSLGKALEGHILQLAEVKDLTYGDNQFTVTYSHQDGRQEQRNARAVVYTGQMYALRNISINSQVVPEFESLQKIYYPPVTVLHLGFNRKDVLDPLDGFGILIPEVEKFNILGILFSSTIFPDRAPDGKVLLTVFIGGARQPENALKDEKHLVAMAMEDLRPLLQVNADPVFVSHCQWKHAIPQYEVGYGTQKQYMNDLEKQYPGLFFSGSFRNGISVADTIVNAYENSDSVESYLKSKTTKVPI